jgi:hypothetical protein
MILWPVWSVIVIGLGGVLPVKYARGALPPVDLRAVCLVRAIIFSVNAQKLTMEKENCLRECEKMFGSCCLVVAWARDAGHATSSLDSRLPFLSRPRGRQAYLMF